MDQLTNQKILLLQTAEQLQKEVAGLEYSLADKRKRMESVLLDLASVNVQEIKQKQAAAAEAPEPVVPELEPEKKTRKRKEVTDAST